MAVSQNTTRVIKFAAAADAQAGVVKVKWVLWVKPTTAGDDLLITDTDGNEKVAYSIETNNQSVQIMVDDIWDGIIVATLDHGYVLICIE